MAALYSEISVTSDLNPYTPKNLRLEITKMVYDLEKCGAQIRLLRRQNKYTQERVAQVLNIDRSFYSRIESGKNGCSVDLLIQLSDLFEVSLDYLILGKYNYARFENTECILLKEEIKKLILHLEQLCEGL